MSLPVKGNRRVRDSSSRVSRGLQCGNRQRPNPSYVYQLNLAESRKVVEAHGICANSLAGIKLRTEKMIQNFLHW